MGGAERAERRRKQQAMQAASRPSASAPAKPAPAGPDRRRLVTGVVVAAVLAAAVLGGLWWQRARSAPPELVVRQVAAEYPTRVDGGVVVAGADTAKLTVDVYEDFLCPACRTFEERDGGRIEQALAGGTLRVRYHVLNLLDDMSNPPGYSLDAASAALCAADAGRFPSYHASLFASQPREGGRGHTVDQLVHLGRSVGISGADFEQCVRGGTHRDAVRAQLDAASADPALRRPGPGGGQYFGTPTVVVGGAIVDLSNANWLDDAVRAAG